MTRRLAALVVALGTLTPHSASADWLLTPYVGTAFAGATTLTDLEQGAGRARLTIGASLALMSDGIFGLEFDVAHSPGFFGGDVEESVVLGSRVTSYVGNVVLAAPLAFTRESLRPYVVAGFGVVQARTQHIERLADLFSADRNLPALTLGGGATGFLTPDAGLRFDVRYLRALGDDSSTVSLLTLAAPGVARLSFWRASVGVTIRLRS